MKQIHYKLPILKSMYPSPPERMSIESGLFCVFFDFSDLSLLLSSGDALPADAFPKIYFF